MDEPVPKAPSVVESVKAPGRLFRWFLKLKNWFISASWKKKTAFITAIIAFLAIIVVALFLGYLSYKALTGEDLALFLKASADAISLEHGEQATLSFTLSSRNLAFCTAYCEWSITDQGSGSVVESGSGELRTQIQKDILITAPSYGRITTPYQVQVSCQNEVTSTCKSSGQKRTAAVVTLVTFNDTQAEARARKQIEEQAPLFTEQAQILLSKLDGIAKVNDVRIAIADSAKTDAQKIRDQIARLAFAITADNPLTESQLLSLPQTPSLQAYENVRAHEQELITSYASLNQSLAQELFMVLPSREVSVLRQSIAELNTTILAFNTTPFNIVQQHIDVVGYQLTVQPQLALDKANAALAMLFAEENITCNLNNITCTPAEPVVNYADAVQTLVRTCDALKNLSSPSLSTAFIAANCTWQITSFAPVPAAALPIDPRVPEQAPELSFPAPQCCSLGVCNVCQNQEKYPVIFVHGHSFVDSTTPEDNLNAFTGMANALQEEGYLYAGHVFPREDLSDIPYGEFSKLPSGMSFTATYYYDSYPEEGDVAFVVRKTEHIETYSLRLKEAIDVVKHKTGASKVIIVSHSMGGLVARRYLQIFGENDVAALIMIGTPNNGISGRTQTFCPLFGGKNECEDMSQGSIFLQKLNARPLSIPVYTIAGRGCDNREYDGVAEVASVQLSYSHNSVVNGTCEGSSLLHVKLPDVNQSPEVYDIVKSIIAQYNPTNI